jgi:MurNAc alpha-1-phosphate uridylyltransferase
MRAMIFAAGLGTRFKPWTDHHPKALAMVNGKSLLQRNIEYLQTFGVRDVVVNVHHFADQIEEAVRINNGWGSRITISDERAEVLETGGGLMKARYLLEGSGTFLTMNADILTNLNLHQFIEAHSASRALVTLAVMQRESSRQLLFDRELHLRGWRNQKTGEEKGEVIKTDFSAERLRELAFSGIACYNPEIFHYMPQGGKFSLTDFFLKIAPHHPVFAIEHTGDTLLDVGSEEKLKLAEAIISAAKN